MNKLKLEELKVTSFITNVRQEMIRGGDSEICGVIEANSVEGIIPTGNQCFPTPVKGTGACCSAFS